MNASISLFPNSFIFSSKLFYFAYFCEFLRLPVSSIYDHFSVLEHAKCTECYRFCVTYPRRSRYISIRFQIFIRDAIGHSICRGRNRDFTRMGCRRMVAFFGTQSDNCRQCFRSEFRSRRLFRVLIYGPIYGSRN